MPIRPPVKNVFFDLDGTLSYGAHEELTAAGANALCVSPGEVAAFLLERSAKAKFGEG